MVGAPDPPCPPQGAVEVLEGTGASVPHTGRQKIKKALSASGNVLQIDNTNTRVVTSWRRWHVEGLLQEYTNTRMD